MSELDEAKKLFKEIIEADASYKEATTSKAMEIALGRRHTAIEKAKEFIKPPRLRWDVAVHNLLQQRIKCFGGHPRGLSKDDTELFDAITDVVESMNPPIQEIIEAVIQLNPSYSSTTEVVIYRKDIDNLRVLIGLNKIEV